MGLAGPRPKPTVLMRLEGNRGHRPLNDQEPEFARGIPKPPPHLDKEARREWKRIAPLLDGAGLVTQADYFALGNLCQAYSTLAKAQDQLSKSALLIKTPSGYVQQNPCISIINSQVDIINKLCREFGLTPSARRGLNGAAVAKQTDSIEAALCG